MPMTGWVGHLVRLDSIKLVNLERCSFGVVFGQDPLIERVYLYPLTNGSSVLLWSSVKEGSGFITSALV
jgi:hypothetical protein